mgnify:CR=1 FL=1
MLSDSISLPAKIFGFGGLAPFLILALSAWTLPDPYRLLVFDILVHYAAVILSFVGNLRSPRRTPLPLGPKPESAPKESDLKRVWGGWL